MFQKIHHIYGRRSKKYCIIESIPFTILANVSWCSPTTLDNNITFTTTEVNYYLVNSIVLLLISAVASTPILKAIAKNVNEKYKNNTIVSIIECVTIIILIIVCTSFIIDKSVNPFLYFKF